MHVPDGSYHKPALPKKSHHCQVFTSLMGGECSQHWTSQSTCQETKEAPAYGGGTTAHTPRGTEPTRSLRRRHGTYLPLRPRTNWKMDPALAGLLSVHVNTLEQWLANMAPNYRQYMMPRRYMHNAAEEPQQMKRPNIGRRRVNSQW